MSTISHVETFQTLLTERFNHFAMVIFQDVTQMIKAYQEENSHLRSLLNDAMVTRRDGGKIDHNISGVKKHPPDLNIPSVEIGAERCAKMPKLGPIKSLDNVTEEEKNDVSQPSANATKEELMEEPVSFVSDEAEPLAGTTTPMGKKGLSDRFAFEGSVQLADLPKQLETQVSEPLANEPSEWKLEYDRSLALKQNNETDTVIATNCLKRNPKATDTTKLQAMAFGDLYPSIDFLQPSTSGQIGKQDLLLPECTKITSKKNTIYCSFCGFNLQQNETSFCGCCGKNIAFLFKVNPTSSCEGRTRQNALAAFLNFRSLKKEGRLSCFKHKTGPPGENTVKISIGLMLPKDGMLKAVRGMILPLAVKPGIDAERLLRAAEQRMKDLNKHFQGGPYTLLYPDGTQVTYIPGTEQPFCLKHYKEAVGKAYQRITLYISTADDFNKINCD
ncbi:uncharacterized protein LOC144203606 isoform X2 [Stigmatopora nigra]